MALFTVFIHRGHPDNCPDRIRLEMASFPPISSPSEEAIPSIFSAV